MITQDDVTEVTPCDLLHFECRMHLDPFTDRLKKVVKAWEGDTKAVQAFEHAVYTALKKLLETQHEGCLEELTKE